LSVLTAPIIDSQPWFSGTPASKQRIAQAIKDACRGIGFLFITQHQIPGKLIERMSDVSRSFFALPLAEKRLVERPRPDAVRGYCVPLAGISWIPVQTGI